MVAVRLGYSQDTYYIIGEFWEIVARLKANHARFRFRARRWRWPDNFAALEAAMWPYAVLPVTLAEAQQRQLLYDRDHIQPTQQWIAAHIGPIRDSVEWWEATRFKRKEDPKSKKLYATHQERVALALAAINLPAAELERDQIVALQQTQRLVEKYESRIAKWATERDKARRREALIARFEDEIGLSRENLLEAEASRGASRQALYEELNGLDWMPHEIAELKAAAKFLLKQKPKTKG